MLKIVMEDLEPGEVAAMYEENGDAIIFVARDLPDDQRCQAVNRLLARLNVRVNPYRFPRLVPHAAPPAENAHDEPGSPNVRRLAH